MMISKTIYLEGIDFTIFRMIIHRIFLQCCFHFLRQVLTFFGQSCLLVYLLQNLGCLTQRRYGKEIGRNQELKRSSIVRRTETGNNQTDWFHRCSQTVIAHSIQCTFRLTLEFIRTYSVFALLLFECFQYISDCLNPFFVKYARISGSLPVMIGQAQRITQRVYFPFTFVQLRFHVRKVTHPMTVRNSAVIKSIRVRIDIDTFELAENNTCQHFFQFGIRISQLYVRPYLCTGVAQPHGVNIARIYERIRFAIASFTEMYSGVQRIRETVGKHPCQLRILQKFLYTENLLLYRIGTEQTIGYFRAVIFLNSIRQTYMHFRHTVEGL